MRSAALSSKQVMSVRFRRPAPKIISDTLPTNWLAFPSLRTEKSRRNAFCRAVFRANYLRSFLSIYSIRDGFWKANWDERWCHWEYVGSCIEAHGLQSSLCRFALFPPDGHRARIGIYIYLGAPAPTKQPAAQPASVEALPPLKRCQPSN